MSGVQERRGVGRPPQWRRLAAGGAQAQHVESVAMALKALSVSELTGDLVLDAGGRAMPVTSPQLTHTRWWWCPVRSSASSNRVNASFP
jgi:hypothetical protein